MFGKAYGLPARPGRRPKRRPPGLRSPISRRRSTHSPDRAEDDQHGSGRSLQCHRLASSHVAPAGFVSLRTTCRLRVRCTAGDGASMVAIVW